MIDSYFRNTFQRKVIEPILKTPILKLHPIILTSLGLFFGLIGSVYIYLQMPKLATLFILLSGFLDIMDGSVARKKGLVSNIGASLTLLPSFLRTPPARSRESSFFKYTYSICH